MLLHSARVHALSSRVPCVLVLTQSELGDATGQRRQGRSDWVQSQPSPRTNVQPICSTYSNTGIHFNTFNFLYLIFLIGKGPLPVYSDVLLAHSFEALVAILSCTLLHPSHRTLPVAPVFQFFLLLSLICVAVLIESCTIPLKWKNMAVTFISVQFYISIACALCPSMHMAWAELSKKVSSITHVNLCGFFFSFG